MLALSELVVALDSGLCCRLGEVVLARAWTLVRLLWSSHADCVVRDLLREVVEPVLVAKFR